MIPPTPAELREAAEYLYNWYSAADGGGYIFAKHLAICKFIFSHFPADGQEPITADWLQKEWGAVNYSNEIRIEGVTGRFYFWPEEGLSRVHVGNTTATLTTRQQFRTLANLLGIEPKRKETE